MKLSNIHSSTKNNKLILSGQIITDSGKTHTLYFEIDKQFKDYASQDASPFFAAALPLAMLKKEGLEIKGSISKNLLKNTPKIMQILKSWNRGFAQAKVNPSVTKLDIAKPKGAGCFFSGGADSLYTYIKNNKKIDHLIFVHGFDINVDNFDLYNKIEKNISKIARQKKKKLIKVRTNIREIFDEYFDWELSHGFAIASVALFLRFGLKEIYLSCGLPTDNADHHYLTPDLDILWSTENMKLNHYGCKIGKTSKLKFLSSYQLALDNLRVCWVNKNGEYNCCECEKCFRNMLGLYAAGALQKCKTFNKKIDINRLRNLRVDSYCQKYFRAVLDVLKFDKDNSQIKVALEDCISNNAYPKFSVRVYRYCRDSIRFLDQNYNRNRLYWYLSSKGLIK